MYNDLVILRNKFEVKYNNNVIYVMSFNEQGCFCSKVKNRSIMHDIIDLVLFSIFNKGLFSRFLLNDELK